MPVIQTTAGRIPGDDKRKIEMDDMLTTKQAAKYLGVKPMYLLRLTHEKKIPYYKYGGRLNLYKIEELEAWKAARITRIEKSLPVPYLDLDDTPEYPTNISTDCVQINEDWEIDKDGDLISKKGKGHIEKSRLKEKDWLLHYHGKGPDTFYNFFEAYCQALKRAGLKDVKIQITY